MTSQGMIPHRGEELSTITGSDAGPDVEPDRSSAAATVAAMNLPGRRAALRPGLFRFVLRRLAVLPFTVLLVVALSFFLVALIPQSTAHMIAGEGATAERVAQVNHVLGLDKPLINQFGDYLGRLVHGNLGTSFYLHTSVASEVRHRVPASIEMILPGFLLAMAIGMTIGSLGAAFDNRWPDKFERGWSTVLHSVPEFLLAQLLLYLLFFRLGWVPGGLGRLNLSDVPPPRVTGFMTIDTALAGQWTTFWHAIQHLILPVLVHGLAGSVLYARISRAALGNTLNSKHVEFARAIGLKQNQLVRYAFLDIRTSMLTYVALGVAAMVGGSSILETVFNWNGLGQGGVQAMLNLDPPMIQGVVLVAGLFTLTIFVILDVITSILDPRISITND
jgi:ABC-type dipeptide/oligopeptide/nickel transport system permease component